ncbi:MAG TPA: copper resistance protein CopC [Gemmatirosa sp.]
MIDGVTGRIPAAWATARERRFVASLITVLLVALVPRLALAHAHLVRSAPSAGARLTAAPTEIRLTFSEAPELAVSLVRLVGPDGMAVPLGTLADAPGTSTVVVAAVRGPLGAGTYTVTWQVVASDGHPSHGQFAFTVAADTLPGASGGVAPRGDAAGRPAPGPAARPRGTSEGASAGAVPGNSPATAFGVESPWYAAIRWLQYVGVVLVLGAVAFRYAVLRFLGLARSADARPVDAMLLPALRTGAAQVGLGATLAVALAAVLRLLAQASAVQGASIGALLLHTVWGTGWLLQVVGAVVVALGFALARQPRAGGWGLATLGAAALAVAPALSGHAASAPHWTALVVVADAAHIVGAGGWLGSLAVVVAVGVPAARRFDPTDRDAVLADLVHAFSPTALVFAGVVAVTGAFATWAHVGSVPALWQTAYGRTLLVKLALLAVVAAAGAYNWRRVGPTLGTPTGAASGATGATRLRRSATLELLVGLLVLAATAVLVATPPPVELHATAQEAAR